MRKIIRSKSFVSGLVLTFFLFSTPYLLPVEALGNGDLVGLVYAEDESTPAKGVVIKMRNISTGVVLESNETDEDGIFKLEKIDEGLYLVGISTKDVDFNLENLIGIKAGETVNASFSLKPVPAEKKKKEDEDDDKGILGFFLSPGGIVVILAASAAIAYTVVKLTETEEEASPFQK